MISRHFLVPGSLERKTGGSIYDNRIVKGARAAATEITVHELPDDFPVPAPASRAALVSCLGGMPDGSTVIIDGLISGCVPDILSRESDRLRLVSLVHHPLADETGLSASDVLLFRETEREALSLASAVIVTSDFTKQRLGALFGARPEDVFVVPPGTDPRPVRTGGNGSPVNLLCVGSLTRRKGYPILIEALSELTDEPWRLHCVGSATLDPVHAHEIERLITDRGLTGRITVTSDLSTSELSTCYDQADVFVFPSLYEGFGMVVTEAISHALPIVTTTGGALRHTAPEAATLFVEPGDIGSFREALRGVLRDPALRRKLAEGAEEARRTLPTWEDASARFLATLHRIEAPHKDVGHG